MQDVKDLVRLYEQAKTMRQPYEEDWKNAAKYCLPRHYGLWQSSGSASQGSGVNAAQQARVLSVDTTGARALPKYTAILNRLLTPQKQRWHVLGASDKNLMKIKAVRNYFEETTDLLFRSRYHPRARFSTAQSESYTSLGLYGNGVKYIGKRPASVRDPKRGLHYRSVAMRNVYFLLDAYEEVDTVFRDMYMNARQVKNYFVNAGFTEDKLPKCIKMELEKPTPSETDTFLIIHCVRPALDYDPKAMNAKRFPFASVYVCHKEQAYVGEREGFSSMPYITARTFTEPNDAYGYSPAVQALPALGSASAMKRTHLKQGQKAVEPVLLAHDDRIMNGRMDLRPSAVNFGAIDSQGRRLVQTLETGNFQIAEKMLDEERKDIEDSFFVSLFQILQETPEMTATEVVERVAEKTALIAPTMERLQAEDLGPTIEREITLHAELEMLPEMPPELLEAQGEYEVVYTSPLAKSMQAEEVSGFMRSVEFALNVSQATQNPEPLDHFDFDTAIPEIAYVQAVPARWLKDIESMKAAREGRGQKAEQQSMVDAAPALANVASTMMKAGKK
jgi:hypothetical protein